MAIIGMRLLPCCDGCFRSRGSMLTNGVAGSGALGGTNAVFAGGTVMVVNGVVSGANTSSPSFGDISVIVFVLSLFDARYR